VNVEFAQPHETFDATYDRVRKALVQILIEEEPDQLEMMPSAQTSERGPTSSPSRKARRRQVGPLISA
jgi:hypothetical protein